MFMMSARVFIKYDLPNLFLQKISLKKMYLTSFCIILHCFQSVDLLSQQKTIAPGDRIRITTFHYLNDGSEKKSKRQ